MKKENKKAQVTLFIIVAIIIVSGLIVFFIWSGPETFFDKGSNLGFEGCVNNVVEGAIDELSLKAGYINPELTYLYMDEEIPYLCYTEENYQTCVVQKPFLKQHFESELERYLREEIDECYEDSLNNLRSQGYDVRSGKVTYDINFEPGVARTTINAPTAVGTSSYTKFNAVLNTNIYEILMISNALLQYEAQYGDSDTDTLSNFYPQYSIQKVKRGDGTTIYMVEDKITKTKFQFASKSLVWPAGYR